jgi:hypothetical protein
VAGFFADFVERSAVDIGYYISMGGAAYGSVSDLLGSHRGDRVGGVYGELSAHFPTSVDVLDHVAEKTRSQKGDEDLLKLYQRWQQSGSDRLHRRLLKQGLLHNPPGTLQ